MSKLAQNSAVTSSRLMDRKVRSKSIGRMSYS
jgi:hypothetical protein